MSKKNCESNVSSCAEKRHALQLGPACAIAVSLSTLFAAPASADKLGKLTQLLLSRSAPVKARKHAASSLGRLRDARAIEALTVALNDANPLVRKRARKALGRTTASAPVISAPAASAPPSARSYHIAVGFGATPQTGAASEHMQLVRETLLRELQSVPGVTLAADAEGAPRSSDGFYIDGSIRFESTLSTDGRQLIDCELRTLLATRPGQSIKMMSTEGAAVATGLAPAAEAAGKRNCLIAAALAVRDDVRKYLATMK